MATAAKRYMAKIEAEIMLGIGYNYGKKQWEMRDVWF
jgi:hypothetical protein